MTVTLSRRHFLGASALAALGAGLTTPIRVFAAPQAATPGRVVVAINLNGGNDWLNTVVDLAQYGHYADARPTLRIPEASLVTLDASRRVAVNPGLAALAPLYAAGRLAVIPGVGVPESASGLFDHEASQLNFQTGLTVGSGFTSEPTGWLGRWLARVEPGLVSAGIELNGGFLLANDDPDRQALAVGNLDNLDIGSIVGEGRHLDAYRAIQRNAPTKTNPVKERNRAVRTQAFEMSRVIAERTAGYTPAVEYRGELGASLQQCARLISAPELGVRALSVGIGGFDTHAAQRAPINGAAFHDALLAEVGDGIAAFLADLDAQTDDAGVPLSTRVVVVVFSEFGRRVYENADRGTDHGFGGGMLVAGAPVRGGIWGDFPRVDNGALFHGSLFSPIDFRQVYATVLERFLDTPHGEVLPGGPFTTLGFL